MRYKNILIQWFCIAILLFGQVSKAADCQLKDTELLKKLGWVSVPGSDSVCGGFYREFPVTHLESLFQSKDNDNYQLQADQVTYSLKESSVALLGHVRVTQKQRELTADTAHAYFDKKTGKVKSLHLKDNIRLIERGKLLLAEKGDVYLSPRTFTLWNVIYRIIPSVHRMSAQETQTGRLYQLSAWGQAEKAEKEPSGVINLQRASYTACLPTDCVWKLTADRISLDPNRGKGYAVDTKLWIKHVPILRFPYFSFPIDRKRKSGFLMPSYHFSSQSGSSLLLPYYWNIAPNYDATLTPRLMTKRGVLFNGLFRYLTSMSEGSVDGSWIPKDFEFENFKKRAVVEYSARPTVDELKNASSMRYAFSWRDQTTFNPHLTGEVHYDYVSDDYYLKDFRSNSIDNSNNQLLQTAQLNYANDIWQIMTSLQNYQTLHPVDQGDVQNQYGRLPQIQLKAVWPSDVYGFTYAVRGEAVRFIKERDPGSSLDPVTGNRLNLRPSVSWFLHKPFAYLKSGVQVQMTNYQLKHVLEGQPENESVVVPIVDVKSGLYFDRSIRCFRKNYRQTLEPVVYYLYVPYRHQSGLPYFDTAKKVFDYDFIFQDNRFSGIDRVGDANQVSGGFVSRFIDTVTGQERASVGMGQIYYFKRQRVMLCIGEDCPVEPMDHQNVSPLAFFATYQLNARWNAHVEVTWDTDHLRFDGQNVMLQYLPNQNHVFNISYNFIREINESDSVQFNYLTGNLKQLDVSGYWKLNNHWSMMGRWNYNWSDRHAQTYFYGLAYESCCWAVRFIGARTYIGVSHDDFNKFDNAFYVQVVLKGLGSVGSGDPGALLNQSIYGYVDQFSEGSLIK
jgi:LPS-assembly protein